MSKETNEEHLLAELLGANEELLEAIKMYTDLERVGIEQGALERALADQKVVSAFVLSLFNLTLSLLAAGLNRNYFLQTNLLRICYRGPNF